MKLLIVVFGEQKSTVIPNFCFIFLPSFLPPFLPSFLQPLPPPLCSEGAGRRIDGRTEGLDDITPPLRQPGSQARCGRVSGFSLSAVPVCYIYMSYPTPKFGHDMHLSKFLLVCYPMQLSMTPPFFFGRRAGHAWYKYDYGGM